MTAAETPGEALREIRFVLLDGREAPIADAATTEIAVHEGGVARDARIERDERRLSVALVVDSSEPMAAEFRLHFVDAVRSFIASLPDGSHLAVWTTGDRPQRVFDLDRDRGVGTGTASEVIARLRRVPALGGNTILDAVLEAARELRAEEGERKVVVFLSGSRAGFSSLDREGVVARGRAGKVEYTGVLVSDGALAGGSGDVAPEDYDYALGGLSRATAGRFERVLTPMNVSAPLGRVARDLRSTYRALWNGNREGGQGAKAGKKRAKIEVLVARPGVKPRVSEVF
jgi:hypothetical protein